MIMYIRASTDLSAKKTLCGEGDKTKETACAVSVMSHRLAFGTPAYPVHIGQMADAAKQALNQFSWGNSSTMVVSALLRRFSWDSVKEESR